MNPSTVTITVSVEEINTILLALGKLPFEQVADFIFKIRMDAQRQVDEQQAAQDAKERSEP